MPGAWHDIHIAIITPAMATKRKAHTVTTKLQAVEVAKKMSKEAAAMSLKNSQSTVLKDDEVVDHLPCTISRVSWFFLRRGGRIICRKYRKAKTQ